MSTSSSTTLFVVNALWMLACLSAVKCSDFYQSLATAVSSTGSSIYRIDQPLRYLYLHHRIILSGQLSCHILILQTLYQSYDDDRAVSIWIQSLSHLCMAYLCFLSVMIGVEKLTFFTRFLTILSLIAYFTKVGVYDDEGFEFHCALFVFVFIPILTGVGYFPEIDLQKLLGDSASMCAITNGSDTVRGTTGTIGKSRHRPDKPLSVVILTIGTRGDVQPFVSFGVALRNRYENSKVTICAFRAYKPLVERYGLEFSDVGFDELDQQGSKWLQATHVSEVVLEMLTGYASHYPAIGKAFLQACIDKDADLIIATSITLSFGLNIREKLQKPCWVVKFSPDLPTREFPPPDSSMLSGFGLLNLVRWYIHWLRIGLSASKSNMGEAEKEFRVQTLGLEELKGGKRMSEMSEIPTIFAYSSSIIPRPHDYGSNFFTTGFWFADGDDTKLQDSVVRFLRQDSSQFRATICVTFGSMGKPGENFLLVENTIVALHSYFFPIFFPVDADGDEPPKKVRILLIASSFSSMLKKIFQDYRNDIEFIAVTEAPHEIVFPKCDIVIHHGGAGTTARALQCGVPSIVVPVLRWTDQPFWADHIDRKRLGVHVPRHTEFGAMDKAYQRRILRALRKILETNRSSRKSIQTITKLFAEKMERSGVENAVSLIDKLALS